MRASNFPNSSMEQMKPLITIFIILIGVGCGVGSTEDLVVGTYAIQNDFSSERKITFRNDKVFEKTYKSSRDIETGRWKVIDGVIEATAGDTKNFYRIENNGDLTWVAYEYDQKRKDFPTKDFKIFVRIIDKEKGGKEEDK